MVNTRILEQRLGWRTGAEAGSDLPDARPIRHAPILQGRVRQQSMSGLRGAQRGDLSAAWDDLPMAATSMDELATNPAAPLSIRRGSIPAQMLDRLRGQMLRAMRENGWRRIGICAPAPRCGTSFIAAGLAASFTRLDGVRVLLTDLDLGTPGLAASLGLPATCTTDDLLDPDQSPIACTMRVGDGMALALSDTGTPDPARLALAPETALALRAMLDALSPDVAIYDLPPLLGSAAAAALLPHMDAVLLVVDGTRTTAREVTECERLLEGYAPLLGVILNRSEDRAPAPVRQG